MILDEMDFVLVAKSFRQSLRLSSKHTLSALVALSSDIRRCISSESVFMRIVLLLKR